MKHVRKAMALLLVLCCCVGTIVPAFAAGIDPLALSTSTAKATLSIGSNRMAACTIFARAADPAQYVEVTTTLYRMNGTADSPEASVATWTTTGKYRMSETKSYKVVPGHDYHLWSYIVVRDANNKVIESFWTRSSVTPC